MKQVKWLTRAVLLMLVLVLTLSAVACNPAPTDDPETDPTETNPTETDPTETNPTETNPTETDPAETEPAGSEDNLPTLDMGKREFTFLMRNDEDSMADIGILKVFESSSSIDRAVYTRNMAVQDLYNVILNFKGVSDLASAIIAGRVNPDQYGAIVGMGRNIFNGIMSGYYADWNDLEYVDLTQEYWAQSAVQQWSTPGGKLFAMNGDLSYLSVGNATAMYFNKTIINDIGLTSPYELVYNDAWTVEAFIQLVTDCDSNMDGNGSGVLSDDTFGYATERWRGPIYATFCGGVGALEKKNDGTYKIGIAKESVADVIQDYIDMVNTSGVAHYTSDLGGVRNAFMDGRVAFLDDNVSCAINFSGLALDFGILPWPKATSRGDYVSLVGSGTNTFAVYGNMSAAAMTESSAVLEAMACYGKRDVLDYYYSTVLSYQGTKDEDSLAMLEIIHDSLFFDFAHYACFGGIGDVVKKVLDEPETYGGSIYTGISHLEDLTMVELELWYLLDVEEE